MWHWLGAATNLGLTWWYVGAHHSTHSLPHIPPDLVVSEDAVYQDVDPLAGVQDDGDVEADLAGLYGGGDPGDAQQEGEKDGVPQGGDNPRLRADVPGG